MMHIDFMIVFFTNKKSLQPKSSKVLRTKRQLYANKVNFFRFQFSGGAAFFDIDARHQAIALPKLVFFQYFRISEGPKF